MPRGRPPNSIIRQNIVEILAQLNEGYGYQIAKIYNEVFPAVTQRSVYYHLRRGIQTKEIILHTIKVEKGDFSWGKTVEKIYYSLGPNAVPQGNEQLTSHLKKWQKQPLVSKFTSFAQKFRKAK